MSRCHAEPARPLCIVLSDGKRLAVPPMERGLPGPIRVRVFEYVLRRQIGLAQMTAEGANPSEQRSEFAMIASLLQATPHRTARGSVAA